MGLSMGGGRVLTLSRIWGDSAAAMDEPDISRAANILIKRHGTEAPLAAAQRADELLAAGDVEGCAIWKRIMRAVEELARTEPVEGEKLN